MSAQPRDLSAALRRDFSLHRQFLWGLCYRMTGSAADAEDLVQDTFERALSRPPPDTESSLRPWLTRVAVNLSCDLLRRRKRAPYRGTWLPEPVPTEELLESARDLQDAEARYDMLESATYAFLLALEVLAPQPRAVLLLRDVFDYSVRETAAVLEISEANVKTTLHRARRALERYDTARTVPSAELTRRVERALKLFSFHLATDNVKAIEAMLREDVVALQDPGDFVAAGKPVVGRHKVVLFHRKVLRLEGGWNGRFTITDLNGMPAVAFEGESKRANTAARYIFRLELDSQDRICEIHAVLVPRKLGRIDFSATRPASIWQRVLSGGLRAFYARTQPTEWRLSPHIDAHVPGRGRRIVDRRTL